MKPRWVALLALAVVACTSRGEDDSNGSAGSTVPARPCFDRDGDGYGRNCAWGDDCNDTDPSIHTGCLRCALPDTGCACEPGTAPVACFLDKTEAEDGTVMCHEGTRYCRDGLWSACEGIHTYPLPSENEGATSLIEFDPDAGPIRCNDCSINCYRITDNLDPIDGGLVDAATNVDWANGGGLTLQPLPDAGLGDATIVYPPELPECMPGTGLDPDCDGIPNPYDTDPDNRPFATTNPAIFLDVAPGQIGRGTIDIDFFINSADIYFLVDQTNSMANERDRLKADLTTGDFIMDPDFNCADYDFDLVPNNELKNGGIVGAIRCIIRDTNFGVGFFREIPFTPYVNSDQVTDFIAFGNYHDISGDVNSVLDAINRLTTVGNRDWEENSMVALHSVLTGQGMYFGVTRRGVPPRVDCPAGTWGYPCFRDGAIPIVVLFTDAQFHNGPPSNSFPYDNSRLGVTAGTDEQYHPVPNTNDTFEDVYDLGDLTNSFKTFTGDTTNMHADLPASLFSCLSNSDGNDAVFKFTLTQQKQIRIESTGSHFDTVLALYTGVPGTPAAIPASDNTNEVAASAYDFGDVYDNYFQMTGDTSAMSADYGWSEVECGASDASPDAVFKFNLSTPARVALDSSGSSFDTVLALYNAPPPLPPSYTPIANTNEEYSTAYEVGDVYNQIKAFSGSTAAMASDYSAGQVGCNASNGANDAVYSFDLSSPTRVRISTEGSSYDTVLGLFDSSANPVGSASVPPTNEVQSSAYDIGDLSGRAFALTGSTTTMAADIGRTPIGCNSNDYAPEAVFKFSLSAPANVEIDTSGTAWDTVLSLHNQLIDANTTYLTTNNNNETFASALDLGTLNAREVRVLGGNTSKMNDDYDSLLSQTYVPCNAPLLGAYSPDAVYKFSLDTATLVRIDLAGSSFDTTVALHKSPPTENVAAVSNTNDNQGNAIDLGVINNKAYVRTGSTSSLNHDYYIGCDSAPVVKDAVYKFSVTSTTEVHIDTDNSSFDTVIGLYPETIIAEPAPTNVGNSNKKDSSAYNMGSLQNAWYTFVGSTSGAGKDHWEQQCSADKNSHDSYFRFSLPTTRNITITSAGTSFDSVLTLYRLNGSNWTYVTCSHDDTGDEVITQNLSSGNYLLVIQGDRSNDQGNYKLSFRDNGLGGFPNQIACDNDGGSVGASSQIRRTLSPGTYHVVVTGKASSNAGNYRLRIRDNVYWNNYGIVECNNNGGPNSSSLIERELDPGDYWFIIKGYNSSSAGPYALRVTDVNPPPETIPAITCDDDSGGGNVAKITRSLGPGDYWLVLKGDNDNDKGPYTLNLRDTESTASGALLQCDDDSGENNVAVIERNLDPGNYQVIVKGDGASAEGDYRISFRDVTHRSFNRLACDNDSGADTSSYIEQSLAAGEYYAVLKGNTPASKGAYKLAVRDITHRPLSSTFCDDNSSTHSTSRITQTLNPGTYYIALKGKNAAAKGPYQLSVGTGATHNAYYVPPRWSDTLAAVQNTGAHVISVLSCHDDPQYGDDDGDCIQTRNQAIQLANASNALGESLQPLVFDIDGDGSGLSRTVVNAIAELANYLEMDVKVVVQFEPDENPGFLFTVRAISTPGNGCSGIIGNEHQNCTPGAQPKFEIDIENPLNAPVYDNPNDENGGYHFVAHLIGDDQFIIDSVPIYVIPHNVFPDMGPPVPPYETMGTYWQDTAAPGCGGNLRPDWRDLSWNADVHPGTTVSFKACTAESLQALQTCTPREIASVRGEGSCMAQEDCPVGYCDMDIGVCQVARAGTCSSDVDCSYNAFCDMDKNRCTFTSQPVYIGAALAEDNFKSFIRMRIDLSADTGFEQPPVVHSWEMTYYCNNLL